MAKWSTGARDSLMNQFVDDFDGVSVIKVYSGTVPASADAALGGATLLATVTQNGGTTFPGDCLDFDAAASGSVSKDSGTWKCLGANVTTGTPTFARLVIQSSDDGTLSTSQKRVQFACGTGEGELNTGTGECVNGTDYPISFAAFTMAAGT